MSLSLPEDDIDDQITDYAVATQIADEDTSLVTAMKLKELLRRETQPPCDGYSSHSPSLPLPSLSQDSDIWIDCGELPPLNEASEVCAAPCPQPAVSSSSNPSSAAFHTSKKPPTEESLLDPNLHTSGCSRKSFPVLDSFFQVADENSRNSDNQNQATSTVQVASPVSIDLSADVTKDVPLKVTSEDIPLAEDKMQDHNTSSSPANRKRRLPVSLFIGSGERHIIAVSPEFCRVASNISHPGERDIPVQKSPTRSKKRPSHRALSLPPQKKARISLLKGDELERTVIRVIREFSKTPHFSDFSLSDDDDNDDIQLIDVTTFPRPKEDIDHSSESDRYLKERRYRNHVRTHSGNTLLDTLLSAKSCNKLLFKGFTFLLTGMSSADPSHPDLFSQSIKRLILNFGGRVDGAYVPSGHHVSAHRSYPWISSTVLITDEIRRTQKFLMGALHGNHILHFNWVLQSCTKNEIQAADMFLVSYGFLEPAHQQIIRFFFENIFSLLSIPHD